MTRPSSEIVTCTCTDPEACIFLALAGYTAATFTIALPRTTPSDTFRVSDCPCVVGADGDDAGRDDADGDNASGVGDDGVGADGVGVDGVGAGGGAACLGGGGGVASPAPKSNTLPMGVSGSRKCR